MLNSKFFKNFFLILSQPKEGSMRFVVLKSILCSGNFYFHYFFLPSGQSQRKAYALHSLKSFKLLFVAHNSDKTFHFFSKWYRLNKAVSSEPLQLQSSVLPFLFSVFHSIVVLQNHILF